MDWDDSSDSTWRESVHIEIGGVEFLHPTETYFDHGGDRVEGAVAEDMALISRSDAVVAMVDDQAPADDKSQIGTITETVHAAAIGKPVLLLVDDALTGPQPEASDPPVTIRGSADDHWFLINYLTGDSATGRAAGMDDELPAALRDWDGQDAIVRQVDPNDSAMIATIVEGWVESRFTDAPTPVKNPEQQGTK